MRISASISTGPGLKRPTCTPVTERRAEASIRRNLPAVIEQAASRSRTSPQNRPVAALVAQLVAHAEDMPVTRVVRRADPGYGATVYQSIAELGPGPGACTARVI